MSKLDYPIPDFLLKHGIGSVVDNVAANQQVQAPTGVLMAMFGEELIHACTTIRNDQSVKPDAAGR